MTACTARGVTVRFVARWLRPKAVRARVDGPLLRSAFFQRLVVPAGVHVVAKRVRRPTRSRKRDAPRRRLLVVVGKRHLPRRGAAAAVRGRRREKKRGVDDGAGRHGTGTARRARARRGPRRDRRVRARRRARRRLRRSGGGTDARGGRAILAEQHRAPVNRPRVDAEPSGPRAARGGARRGARARRGGRDARLHVRRARAAAPARGARAARRALARSAGARLAGVARCTGALDERLQRAGAPCRCGPCALPWVATTAGGASLPPACLSSSVAFVRPAPCTMHGGYGHIVSHAYRQTTKALIFVCSFSCRREVRVRGGELSCQRQPAQPTCSKVIQADDDRLQYHLFFGWVFGRDAQCAFPGSVGVHYDKRGHRRARLRRATNANILEFLLILDFSYPYRPTDPGAARWAPPVTIARLRRCRCVWLI